jgi:cell division protein FtsB
LTWGGFLILAGFVVGKLQQNLALEYSNVIDLNDQLEKSQEKLQEVNKTLEESNRDLEAKVKERTLELQQSKDAVEL